MEASFDVVGHAIRTIDARLTELGQLQQFPSEHVLGPPASEEAIARLEHAAGFQLPDDYRAFLRLHDGIQHFNGEQALLSIEQMLKSSIRDGLDELQSELRRVGLERPGNGFVFEASYGTMIGYFDLVGLRAHGVLTCGLWDRHTDKSFPSFIAYLEDYIRDLDEMIAKEKNP